jgi:uncharacterized phage-like protein YoqJ
MRGVRGKSIIAATGHRPGKLGGYHARIQRLLIDAAGRELQVLTPRTVIVGMAQGWDQAVALAALELHLPVHAFVPCQGQESVWPVRAQMQYHEILRKAWRVEVLAQEYGPSVMKARNCAMIDACDAVLALWNGTEGGTAHCIRYAQSVGRPIINAWERWDIMGGNKGA